MLTIATTTVTIRTRPAGDTPRDSHDAPLPQAAAVRGPFDAHRAPFSQHVRGASRGGGDDVQVRGSTYYLDPAAWPVHVGDVIADAADATSWRVAGAERVPSGLGLDQVMAACTRLDVSGS